MKLPRWFHRLGSPPHVYGLADAVAPWLGRAGLALMAIGAVWGLVFAPADYLQREVYRIIYVHPQSAYVSMMAYTIMGVAAGVGFIWRIKLAHAVAVSTAPIGTSFTFLALATGAIWGRPTWGTYWDWGDARLMSELLLFFLFLGYLALRAAFDDRDKADRVSAVLAVVGIVNVPIIHYSVEWWRTLHQGPTITRFDEPAIDVSMLIPLLIMIAAFTLVFFWLLLRRLQAEIVERERGTRWLRGLLGGATA